MKLWFMKDEKDDEEMPPADGPGAIFIINGEEVVIQQADQPLDPEKPVASYPL